MLTNSFLIFSLPLLVQAFEHYRRYVHVPTPMNRHEALSYCRKYHTDLAVFGNRTEYEALQNPCDPDKYCWIGLYRDYEDSRTWTWSNGEEVSFTNWNQTQPITNFLNCVVIKGKFWYNHLCWMRFESVCYEDDLILVNENKTWEEALEHCRSLQTDPTPSNMHVNHLYDLPHMHAEHANWYATMIQKAQTQEVWIGLRFLAGQWLWVNGFPLEEQLKKQLPVCPAPKMHCGTMSKTGGQDSIRDCSERRNFFCLKDNLF